MAIYKMYFEIQWSEECVADSPIEAEKKLVSIANKNIPSDITFFGEVEIQDVTER